MSFMLFFLRTVYQTESQTTLKYLEVSIGLYQLELYSFVAIEPQHS